MGMVLLGWGGGSGWDEEAREELRDKMDCGGGWNEMGGRSG